MCVRSLISTDASCLPWHVLIIPCCQTGDILDEDTWMRNIAAFKLLERLVKFDSVGHALGSSKVVSVLVRVVQDPASPLAAKTIASPCLQRLQQLVVDKSIFPIGLQLLIQAFIPWLVEEKHNHSGQRHMCLVLESCTPGFIGRNENLVITFFLQDFCSHFVYSRIHWSGGEDQLLW